MMPQTYVELGALFITPAALHAVRRRSWMRALDRHRRGDWGELDEHDRAVNDDCLRSGGGLLSVYRDRRGVRFFIVTEPDRSSTTILLPEDY